MSIARTSLFTIVLACLTAFVLFFELGRMDIVADNEGQRATPAAEMLRSGQYVIPTINGRDYLAKPPLLYWAVTGVYRLTDTVSAATARIPTAACGLALVLALYLLVRRKAGEDRARWAAVMLLASPYFLERARMAQIDVPLTLAVTFAVLGLHRATHASSALRRWLLTLGAGLALGCALMLKGPPSLLFLWGAWIADSLTGGNVRPPMRRLLIWTGGIVAVGLLLDLLPISPPVPVALIAALLLWTMAAWKSGGAYRGRMLGHLAVALALGIALTAPWAFAVLRLKGWPYVAELLQSQVLERTHTASAINSGSIFYYAVALPGLLAPWGFLLPLQFSPKRWQTSDSFYRFSVMMGWLSVLAFSLIAGKEYEYILPAFPFLCIGLGYVLTENCDDELPGWEERWLRYWHAWWPVLLVACAVAWAGYVFFAQGIPWLSTITRVLGSLAIVFGIIAWRQRTRGAAFIAASTLCVLLMVLCSRAFHYRGTESFRPVGEVTGKLLREGYTVQAVKMTSAFDVYPAFAFYAGTQVPAVVEASRVIKGLSGTAPYYCVMRAKRLPALRGQVPDSVLDPLLGPVQKNVVLIGNAPLPPLGPE